MALTAALVCNESLIITAVKKAYGAGNGNKVMKYAQTWLRVKGIWTNMSSAT